MIDSDALKIEVTADAVAMPVDRRRLRAAIRRVLREAGITAGEIGVAVIDDAAIWQLNRQYLGHDYATDVLSFVLASKAGYVEGQIAVSAETACRQAAEYGWPAADELLLYVVHGALHLSGCDDGSPRAAAAMRRREREILAQFGLIPPWEEAESAESDAAAPRSGRAAKATRAAVLRTSASPTAAAISPAAKGERT